MKRFIDKKYSTYTPYTVIKTGIDVKCPKCGKRGIVSKQEGIYQFSCTVCTKTMKKGKRLITHRSAKCSTSEIIQ